MDFNIDVLCRKLNHLIWDAYIEKDDGKNAALEMYIPELRIRNTNVSLAIWVPNSRQTFLEKYKVICHKMTLYNFGAYAAHCFVQYGCKKQDIHVKVYFR